MARARAFLIAALAASVPAARPAVAEGSARWWERPVFSAGLARPSAHQGTYSRSGPYAVIDFLRPVSARVDAGLELGYVLFTDRILKGYNTHTENYSLGFVGRYRLWRGDALTRPYLLFGAAYNGLYVESVSSLTGLPFNETSEQLGFVLGAGVFRVVRGRFLIGLEVRRPSLPGDGPKQGIFFDNNALLVGLTASLALPATSASPPDRERHSFGLRSGAAWPTGRLASVAGSGRLNGATVRFRRDARTDLALDFDSAELAHRDSAAKAVDTISSFGLGAGARRSLLRRGGRDRLMLGLSASYASTRRTTTFAGAPRGERLHWHIGPALSLGAERGFGERRALGIEFRRFLLTRTDAVHAFYVYGSFPLEI